MSRDNDSKRQPLLGFQSIQGDSLSLPVHFSSSEPEALPDDSTSLALEEAIEQVIASCRGVITKAKNSRLLEVIAKLLATYSALASFFAITYYNKEDSQRVLHTICAVGCNIALNSYFGLKGLKALFSELAAIGKSVKDKKCGQALGNFLMVCAKLGLTWCASDLYVELIREIPWIPQEGTLFNLLYYLNFLSWMPINYFGVDDLFDGYMQPLLEKICFQAALLSGKHFLSFKANYVYKKLLAEDLQDWVIKHLTTVQREGIVSTVVLSNSNPIDQIFSFNKRISTNDIVDDVATLQSPIAVDTKSVLLPLEVVDLIATLLFLLAGGGYLGYFYDIEPSEFSLQFFYDIMKYIGATWVSLGLCASMSTTTAAELVELINNVFAGSIPPQFKSLKRSGLFLLGAVASFVFASETAEPSLVLNKDVQPYISDLFFRIINILTFSGTIFFNGYPFIPMLKKWLDMNYWKSAVATDRHSRIYLFLETLKLGLLRFEPKAFYPFLIDAQLGNRVQYDQLKNYPLSTRNGVKIVKFFAKNKLEGYQLFIADHPELSSKEQQKRLMEIIFAKGVIPGAVAWYLTEWLGPISEDKNVMTQIAISTAPYLTFSVADWLLKGCKKVVNCCYPTEDVKHVQSKSASSGLFQCGCSFLSSAGKGIISAGIRAGVGLFVKEAVENCLLTTAMDPETARKVGQVAGLAATSYSVW